MPSQVGLYVAQYFQNKVVEASHAWRELRAAQTAMNGFRVQYGQYMILSFLTCMIYTLAMVFAVFSAHLLSGVLYGWIVFMIFVSGIMPLTRKAYVLYLIPSIAFGCILLNTLAIVYAIALYFFVCDEGECYLYPKLFLVSCAVGLFGGIFCYVYHLFAKAEFNRLLSHGKVQSKIKSAQRVLSNMR